MNRVIKFRAWDKEKNVMRYRFITFSPESQHCSIAGNDDEDFEVREDTPDRYILIEDVMQFTGLLDKNGVEIYEGDILKSKQTNIRIQWSDKAYGDTIGFGAIGMDGNTEYNIHHFCAHGEIIGNIYENSELIEKSV